MLRRLAVLLPPLAAALVFAAPGAPAATIKVTTTQDLASGAGACSLREAVLASNGDSPVGGCPAGSGADVIRLQRGATYTLTIPGFDHTGEAGDLNVTGAVAINPRGTTLDGGGIDRIFEVEPGGSLSLSNLTLTGGAPSADDQFSGGGAVGSFGTLVLRHVVVTHNLSAEAAGGAIVSSGALTVIASAISDNQSLREDPGLGWGGISSGGTLTMRNSVVAGNEFGSVAVGGVATISGTLIAGGTVDSGPGLENAGSLHLTGSTVRDGSGGVTNTASGELWISDSTISGSSIGPAVVFGSSSGANGAGVWNAGTLHLAGSTISGNTLSETCAVDEVTQECRDDGGAGIYNTGSLDVQNSTVSGNTIERPCAEEVGGTCPANPGAGILNAGGTFTATGVTVADNSGATSGGGIAVTGGSVSLTGSIVADNAAGQHSDCEGGLALLSYSLLRDASGCTIGSGSGSLFGDPLLGPLGDNGGPTETQALLPGSPAIDAGPPTRKAGCPRADQRGIKRPQDGDGVGGARCDIGAYEVAPG